MRGKRVKQIRKVVREAAKDKRSKAGILGFVRAFRQAKKLYTSKQWRPLSGY